MNLTPLRILTRTSSFIIGFGIVYGFANPDLDRVYELFPAFKQKDYAFFNFYEVEEDDKKEFEKTSKALTRFLQRQPGYGFTRLVRLDGFKPSESLSKYQYVGIQTWFSPDTMKKAVDSTFSQKIISKLKIKNPYNAMMYKIAVDDSTYSPE